MVEFEAIGQSEAFFDFQERLSRVAPIDRPVLLIGERGTGKELAAARLHYLSLRWQSPLIALNCSALASSLIESELFGYEKGAFTGALQRRAGRFESADGGTLFLDEIGAIPVEVQEKILRVVEYGTFERVGGSEPVEVDVRIIGATNADLLNLAKAGRFKMDLLDRLSFEVIFVPPLRDRKGDVLLLANHFARRMAYELGREETPMFGEDAIRELEGYSWAGNIRELKNVVERAVYRSESNLIADVAFDPFRSPYSLSPPVEKDETPKKPSQSPPRLSNLAEMPLKTAVEKLEIYMVRKALADARYNQKKAAQTLGLSYDQFRGLKRKYVGKVD
ncbi:phage shock protein operon transcriptional activator [Thermodesulfobacteriota bacterium]